MNRHERSFHPFELAKEQEKQLNDDARMAKKSEALVVQNEPNNKSPDNYQLSDECGLQNVASSLNASDPQVHFSESPVDELPPELDSSSSTTPPTISWALSDRDINRQQATIQSGSPKQPSTHPMEAFANQYSSERIDLSDSLTQTPPGGFQLDMGGVVANYAPWHNTDEFENGEFSMSNSAQMLTQTNHEVASTHDSGFGSLLGTDASYIDFDFSVSNILFDSTSKMLLDNSIVNQWEGSDYTGSVSTGTDHVESPIRKDSASVRADSGAKQPARLPSITKEKPKAINVSLMDETIYYLMTQDIEQRLPGCDLRLPSMQSFNSFLKGYLYCFHKHFPILHLPHLEFGEVPNSLVLAMCAIGALYRQNRTAAKKLWLHADLMVESVCIMPQNLR